MRKKNSLWRKGFLFTCMWIISLGMFAQNITVRGTVTDANNEPIIGATIVVQGDATKGTVTDVDGNYVLNNVPNKAILKISYVGMVPQIVPINGRTSINIVMNSDTELLDEVVVVGYGTQKKVNLTGSISTLEPGQLTTIPVSNLSNALSGRLAGVLVMQSGGKPGFGSSIAVRAQGTWNDATPLYVIDGIVRDKFAFDGLNSSEIENLSVLKDAASAAVYGSRGANGVILVTTKKGKQGKPIISYSGSFGVSDATMIPKTQSAYDQATFINDSFDVLGYAPNDVNRYAPDELDYYKTHSWNWIDESWRKPILTTHSINVNGGTERVRYFIGGGYYYETGSFDNLSYNKFDIRSNIEANITKDLIATLNINLDRRNDDKPYWRYDDDNDNLSNLYNALLLRSAMRQPYINGLPNGTNVEWHPLEIINSSTGYNRKNYTMYDVTASLQWNIPWVKGLSLKAQYNRNELHRFDKMFNLPYTLYVFERTGTNNHIVTDKLASTKVRNDGNFLLEYYRRYQNYQFNTYLTYDNQFGKHNIGALLVYEQAENWYDYLHARGNYFISGAIDQLYAGSQSASNSTISGTGSESGRLSYVGRVNYGYDEKYLFEASFRYDGSVKFAPNKRWGFFPSASAAWRISEETFFKNNVQFIDYMKIRASVGLLGNDAVGGWQWQQAYSLTNGAYFGTSLSNGVAVGSIPNENITWEKSLAYNGGVDMNFLRNRLTVNVDAYYRDTWDILGSRQASIPSTFGGTMPSENYAEISAKGFEIEAGWQDKLNKLDYYIKGNFGYATNKVIKMDQAANIRDYQDKIGLNYDRTLGYVATDVIRTQADLNALPAGYTIFGAKPELGMMNYKDIRGANSDEPDGKIDQYDQDWIAKHTTPPVTYGFSLGGSWNNFSVDLFFQGVAGSDVIINRRGAQARAEETNFDFWTDHWTPTNTNAKYPRAARHYGDYASTFWTYSGNFLRLKNLTVSYNLPKSFTSKLKIETAKIYFSGNNMCLLANSLKYYDPENPSGIWAYPLMKNYSFGVNLSF